MSDRPGAARRAYWPVVLLGAGAAGLAAWAGHHPWTTLGGDPSLSPDLAASHGIDPQGAAILQAAGSFTSGTDSPATASLALVALASWGLLLVTRGRVRRVVAALAALASAGALAIAVHGLGAVPDDLRARAAQAGIEGARADLTRWGPIAVVALIVALLAAVAALVLAPRWPEMSARYDAPTGAPGAATPIGGGDAAPGAVVGESRDLWKALDEGRDPTA